MKPMILLTLIVTIFLAGCSSASEDTLDFPELSFNINSDLLDTLVFRSSDLIFFPPQGYVALTDSIVNELAKQLGQVSENVTHEYQPVAALFDPSNPIKNIVISTLAVDSISFVSARDFAANFDKKFRTLNPGAESTKFMVNGIRCWQARIIDKNRKLLRYQLIIFRNAIPFKPPYQIDINFPLDAQKDWGRVMESMLGTFSLSTISKETR